MQATYGPPLLLECRLWPALPSCPYVQSLRTYLGFHLHQSLAIDLSPNLLLAKGLYSSPLDRTAAFESRDYYNNFIGGQLKKYQRMNDRETKKKVERIAKENEPVS